MIYVLWIVFVIGSIINAMSLDAYGYESMALVVVSLLGCYREVYVGAINWGLCYELGKLRRNIKIFNKV